MAFPETNFSSDVWTLILFDIDDNRTRGAFRALSPWHENIGETARQIIEARVSATEPSYSGSWTQAFNRLSFWTPWVGVRCIPGVYPEHMNSSAEIRHQTFVNGKWMDRWYIYYYGLYVPPPVTDSTRA